ncbi:imm11 family protein [Clostridium tetanomorphum]|uniref:imm11 family protein n=1 Tax=Clostridium tetanomorphum TaxID=1553 RepID=UPI003BFA6F19
MSVEKYALKKERIQNHHIFKLKGDTIPVFVSERVKDIIVSNNLLGFAFLEVKVV